MSRRPFAALALFALAACGIPYTVTQSTVWTGTLPAGTWVRLRNLSGGVSVEPSTTATIEILATTKGRFRTGDVRFEAKPISGGLIVCTLLGPSGECDESHYRAGSRSGFHLFGGGNVTVDYVVRVPAGVRMDANTVNGSVRVSGVAAPVIAHTVNGAIDVTTSAGPVEAHSVNGSVTARLDSLVGPGDIIAQTVNGSVVAELPATIDGELEMSTVNGRFTTDYPVTVSGNMSSKHLRATLGAGGRIIKLETVNGSVTLRKRGAAAT